KLLSQVLHQWCVWWWGHEGSHTVGGHPPSHGTRRCCVHAVRYATSPGSPATRLRIRRPRRCRHTPYPSPPPPSASSDVSLNKIYTCFRVFWGLKESLCSSDTSPATYSGTVHMIKRKNYYMKLLVLLVSSQFATTIT
ncbi:hypothetical protein L9F63_022744, partial [Diploptera punctata]